MNTIWKDHAEFLGNLTDQIIDVMTTNGQTLGEYTEWLAEACFRHAEKHCREDFENRVLDEREKVADEPLVDKISVSGDRVKREGPSWDKDKKGWDVAKRAPHVYENTESVGDEGIDDDSVIKTQEECAKRFAEGEAVRRNYAGIND